jgi:hypothetical protein
MRRWWGRFWPYVGFGVVVALLLAASTLTLSYRDCAADYHKRTADPDQARPQPESKRTFSDWASSFAECEGEFFAQNNGVITAAATVFIALFTLALWRSTDRLWGASERQTRIARRSSMAAVVAAKASKKAVAQSEQTSVNQLRAYMGIFRGAILVSVQDKIRIHLDVMNRGQTPARDVEFFMRAEIRDPEDWKPGPMGEKFKAKWTIAPGAYWTIRFPYEAERKDSEAGAFTKEEVSDVDAGRKQLIIWGQVTYRDVFFPKTEERTTTFCYRRGDVMRFSEQEATTMRVKKAWEPVPCVGGNGSS